MRFPSPLRGKRRSRSTETHGDIRRVAQRASWTAQVCAAQRAAESMLAPDRRRLDDPFSRHYVRHEALRIALLHPIAARAFIAALRLFLPGVHDFVVLRVRYIDDVLDEAASDGIDQIVLLGAGFDTTSMRRHRSGPRFFEVDAPSTQDDKRVMTEALPSAHDNDEIVWVPCDFETDTPSERLLAAGFDPTRRSAVAWIGVTMFLTEHAIDATLGDLAGLCAPGSQLVLDYIDSAVVSGLAASRSARRVARSVASSGEPYRTGFTDAAIDSVLARHGFTTRDHASTPVLQKRYAAGGTDISDDEGWLTIVTAHRGR